MCTNDDFLEELGLGKTKLSQLLDNLTEEYWGRQSTMPCEGWPNKSITFFYNSCGKISFTHSKKKKITKKKLRKEIYKRLKDPGWDYLTWCRQEREQYERHWLKQELLTWQEVRSKINTHIGFYYVCFLSNGEVFTTKTKQDIPNNTFKYNYQPMYYDFEGEEVRTTSHYIRAHFEDTYVWED